MDLIESAGRKTRGVGRLAQAAKIDNARAVTARAEEWAADAAALGGGAGAYDAVTARAVAALPVLVEYAAPLLRADGVLVAWKGRARATRRRSAARRGCAVGLAVEDVRRVVPFEGARDRHLHVFRKISPTPERLPHGAPGAWRSRSARSP